MIEVAPIGDRSVAAPYEELAEEDLGGEGGHEVGRNGQKREKQEQHVFALMTKLGNCVRTGRRKCGDVIRELNIRIACLSPSLICVYPVHLWFT